MQAPENVLSRITAPAKVGRIPAVKVPLPLREEFGIVRRAPSPRDRVAFEVDIDSALLRFGQKLLVGRDRVRISPLDCFVPRLCWGSVNRRFSIRLREMLVCPLDEVLDVGFVRVAAVMLSPGEFAIEHINVHGRHLFGLVIITASKIASTEQSEHWLGGDRGHEAALMIEPLGITAFRNSVADESQARSAKSQRHMRINGQIRSGSTAECGLLGGVLHVVAGHPVISPRRCQVLQALAEITTIKLCSTRTARCNQSHCKPLIKRHRDQRGLAVARHTGDADSFRIDAGFGFKVIQCARRTPTPGTKRAPVVGLAGLAMIRQTDDAARQARPNWLRIRVGVSRERIVLKAARIVLNRRRIQDGTTPSGRDQLVFFRRRTRATLTATATSSSKGEWRRFKWCPSEAHQYGHSSRCILWQSQRHGDVDFDLRASRIVDDSDDVLLDRRLATCFDLSRLADFPLDAGDVPGNAAVDFSLE